jgi:drug/metabolite transporter (DMT)-like permease
MNGAIHGAIHEKGSEGVMNETHRPRQIGRSIGAVLAGAIAGVAVTLGTDKLLQATGIFPPPSQPMRDALLLLATAYRAVYGVAGSYLTARVAPYRPMLHVLVLGAIGCALGIVGVVVTWGQPVAVGHEWYPIALAALAMPQSWLGGFLHRRWHGAP